VRALVGQQVVLAGGASRLKGFDALARELLGRPVTLGQVRCGDDFPATVREMPFAAAFGLLTLVPKPVVVPAHVTMVPQSGELRSGELSSGYVASASRSSVGF
jgi:cell division ATPase FtsA